jgi:hypothetical protein
MTNPTEAKFFEIDMIKNDTIFYANLPDILEKPNSGTIFFGLVPYSFIYSRVEQLFG